MILDQEAYLAHYGTLRKSGRYPWGSGPTQSARNQTFLDTVEILRKQGMSDAEIAKGFSPSDDDIASGVASKSDKLTSTDIRALKSIAKTELKQDQIRMAERLHDKGMSNNKIGERMGINESSVRALRAPGAKEKADVLKSTTDMLRRQVAEKQYIDIGVGVHHTLDITEDKFKVAVAKLREEGYQVRWTKVQQLTTGNETTVKFLKAPDTPFPKQNQIRGITEHSIDSGRNYLGIQTPLSISSKRIGIRYAEDGGKDADGVIYVRPGVKDLSMGGNRYAQVRIAVDGTHFLKGMAITKAGLPDGVDLVFNTNKSNTGKKLDAMKPFKDDEDNPFGSTVRQIVDDKGKVSSVMNIVGKKESSGVEGGWGEWSKSLASQVLSKQEPSLAKTQLNMTYERKRNEFDEIKRLTNPAVKKKLLDSFADDTDSSAIHLKAAALPGQRTHVIMPVNSVKKGEIYATKYNNGDRVALIRYPHGGTFEIPELVVNNRNLGAKRLLGVGPKLDAVGINSSVAERLSGADFDGDTVLVIPNNKGSIKSTPPLDGLRGFDSKSYRIPDSNTTTKRMSTANTQTEMGKITNLISDMTIRGAGTAELAQAIRHSMVVIDAEKHGLDYKASARDNGIASLKNRYQSDPSTTGKGASTLITRAKSAQYVDKRRAARVSEGGAIDRTTGAKRYVPTNEVRRTPDRIHKRTGAVIPGKEIRVQEKSTRLRETNDAYTLVSGKTGTPIERIYADHSNKLKGLANEARLAGLSVKSTPRSPSAKIVYKKEVADLNSKLNVALRNAPVERQAQLLANTVYRQKLQANPNMDGATKKKVKSQAEAEARVRTGARKQRIALTQREWDAIQAGAISNHMLNKILANTDLDQVKTFATPRTPRVISSAKLARANQMLIAGYTQSEVASQLGVSVSTLNNYF